VVAFIGVPTHKYTLRGRSLVKWGVRSINHEDMHPAAAGIQPGRVRNARIMYIESKAGGLVGTARIGRVFYSRTRGTLYYKDRRFQSLKGSGFKAHYFEVETGDHYWISGPRRDGEDRLYVSHLPVEIDDDVREEYWAEIRKKPERASCTTTRGFTQS
jgi:hypothetical protein